jgi:Ser/Thr protein kinase RdoA (MazF antagonist)
MTVGVIHKDFCAANVVIGTDGAPVCVDNANVSVGPHDLDLARTWYRWPMGAEDRRHFAAGYEEYRRLAACLRHFAFWAACVLVGSASIRLRARAPGGLEPLDRLSVLLDRAARGARGADHPFWTV